MIRIISMADKTGDLRRELVSSSKQIMRHLAKIAVTTQKSSYNHWRQEILSFLYVVPKLKSTKKPPSFRFIYDAIWKTWGDSFDVFIKQTYAEYGEETRDVDVADVTKRAEAYLKWLSQELSAKQGVNPNDVYAKLQELGF